MSKPNMAVTFIVFWLVIGGASLLGYVLNIIKLVTHIHDPLTVLLVARMIGIVAAPLGSVLGLFA